MAWLFRGPSRYANPYQKYDNGQCMNSYSTLKDDIYQRIDGYINSDFSEDEKVKKFRSICNNKCKCHINVESNVNTNPPLKRTGRVESCKGGTNCKTEKVKTKEAAGKAKLRSKLDGQSSKAVSLQRPIAQNTSSEHARREESNKQSEVLPDQLGVKTLPNSIKSKDDEPESVTNKESSTFVKGSTYTQALPDIGGILPRELNPQEEDSPSQSSAVRESDAEGTLQVNNPSNGLPQNNLSEDQTIDANHRNIQTHQVGDVDKQDHKLQIDSTEHSDRVSPLGRDSVSVKLDDKDNIRPGTNDVAHVPKAGGLLDTKKENFVSASSEGVSSGDTSLNGKTYDEGVGGAANGREIKNGQELGSEHLCIGTPCNAENGSGLVTDNDNKSDFFGKIFEVISNKEHIIQASAPMGIVLLLGLLFKYTPLWRVLTKKNRKKGVGINEELNSVLQETTIMDDERSIPFSYGAFEYSTFDQNSY
ncbi:hypothetical protein PVMG_06055 [Plasmodium vivax Mauritania I]|uniref:Variable surface protein Vir18 n=1 Tax=Plasmodium vivax Mauritania I TaxID=1035515 RepID=A0A0J9T576_PLAVI|nr:hypothetical protein PVMG_06055 [Plasmodium vivax Mauritania I]